MKNTKEYQIARQSQIKTMLDYSRDNHLSLDLKTLVGAAEVLAEWVNNGYTKELGDRLLKIDEYIINNRLNTLFNHETEN